MSDPPSTLKSRSRAVAIGTWPATRQPVIDRVPQGKNGPVPTARASFDQGRCAREGRFAMSADFYDFDEKRRRAAEQWPGFDPAEALHWSKVLLRHSPDPQRAGIKAQMSEAINRGFCRRTRLVRTATRTRRRLQPGALSSTPRKPSHHFEESFRSHPGHRQVTFKTYLPGTPYESELWSDWPNLPHRWIRCATATTLTLLRAGRSFRARTPTVEVRPPDRAQQPAGLSDQPNCRPAS